MLPWILLSVELCVRLRTLSSMTFQCTQYSINTIHAFLKNFLSSEIVLVGHEFSPRNNEMYWRSCGEISLNRKMVVLVGKPA
jgi:hypothetical protein